MKIVQIIHNPTAGDAKFSKKELVDFFEEGGQIVKYCATDEDDWEDLCQDQVDVIVVAGGDGTIHKIAGKLLQRKIADIQIPIRLLPLGTANNIAKTLGISTDEELEVLNFKGKSEKFDCGKITGLDESFFLESVGFGVFPELISKMKDNIIYNENPAEKLKRTLKVLLDIVKIYEAQKAKIKIEGITIRGSFLLVELMNIKYIGPNFKLAPKADPGDGYFDLVMIPEKARSELIDYFKKLIKGNPEHVDLEKFVITLRVQKLKMKWHGSKLHVDDNLINDYTGDSISSEIIPGVLEFGDCNLNTV